MITIISYLVLLTLLFVSTLALYLGIKPILF